MNPGQGRFHDFIMSLVAPGNEAAAESILANSFGQQNAGRLSPDAVDAAVTQLTPLLKPEGVTELQQAAARMKEMAQHAPGDGMGGPGGPGHWGHHDDGDGMHHHHDWPGQPGDASASTPNPASASQPTYVPAPNPAASSQSS